MKRYLIFEDDGCEYLLVDISYDAFILRDEWTGSSDTAYEEYKRLHNMYELNDFSDFDEVTNTIPYTSIIEK
jgi:hypothetical protein